MSRLALMFLLATSCKSGEPADGSDGSDGGAQTDGGGDGGGESVDVCGTLDLPVRPWADADDDDSLYAVAADLTIPTRRGDWVFSEQWSGCEVYLFIQDEPAQAAGWPTPLWSRDVDALLERLPLNTQVFFMSGATSSGSIEQALDGIEEEVEDALGDLDDDTAAWWRAHLHYVTTRSKALDGWLGDTMRSPGWGVGIDRFQRIRYIGSYADWDRYDSSYGWFEPNLSMAANEAIYYNFEAEREATLDADGATVVQVFDGDRVAGSTDATVALPDAATIEGFDTLTVDMTMACEGDGEYGYCPAWDYMAYLYQCSEEAEANPYADTECQPAMAEVLGACTVDGVETGETCRTDDDCAGGDTGAPTSGSCEGYSAAISADTLEGACAYPDGESTSATYTCNSGGSGYDDLTCPCSREVGRWITTYHREGRWVHDISPMLPYLASGGTQRFRFSTSGPYELTGSLRFSNQGKDGRPTETDYLFAGGTVNSTYNSGYEPLEVEIPADARKVELATVISGHGSDGNNCGEFCNIVHTFTIDGNEDDAVVREFPEAGSAEDCMDKTAIGTVPNQYGTWWYGRAGWCPGKEVPIDVTDVTDQAAPGSTITIEYKALYRGDDYDGSSTNRMHSYLVISK